MYSRTHSSFTRVTVEAADCNVNHQYVCRELLITVEPKEELYASAAAARPQTLSQTLNQQLLAQALQLHTVSDDANNQQTQSLNLPDGYELNSPTDNTQEPTQVTSAPQSITEQHQESTPPRQIPSELTETEDSTTQTVSPGFRHLAEFIFSAEFQHQLATCRYIFSESQYQQIRDEPQRNRDWILHVLDRFPGLLADGGPNLGNIGRYQNNHRQPPPAARPPPPSTRAQPAQPASSPARPQPSSSTSRAQAVPSCSNARSQPSHTPQHRPPKSKAERKQTPSPNNTSFDDPTLSDTSTIAATNSPSHEDSMERPPTPGGSSGSRVVAHFKRGDKEYTVTRTPDSEVITTEAEIHRPGGKKRKRQEKDRN